MDLFRTNINSTFELESIGSNKKLLIKPHMKESDTSGLWGFLAMSKKIEYQNGDVIGECIYLSEIEVPKKRMRKAMFRCTQPGCNNEFTTQISKVRSGHTKSCGCFRVKTTRENNLTHGQSYLPLYYIWKNALNRCYNKAHPKYRTYGVRGITMCDAWREDPKSFIEYVSALPNFGKSDYSIDRIDNDGNYEPGNLRWATRSTQMANRRKAKNKTGFTGVKRMRDKWQSRINIDRRNVHLGTFNNIQDAIESRNNYITEHNLESYYKVQAL